ncbi:(deoxy)nucleoside triphosphate pyrophosphohydrolase [Acinetobacter towneri]|uniref:(deoxy)nucleoside triphosphate pyrophosphohydrolase n=1 Tax=Acinetobacter towneri TaxID=202956 RepID=UPI00321508FF
MQSIEVVAAIIIKDEKILAVQKGQAKFDYVSYKWEFPGGKVEASESLEQAIQREILEELDIQVIPKELLITVEQTYPDFHLVMHCFICSCEHGNIKLIEHIELAWLDLGNLRSLDWAEADIPVVKKLQEAVNKFV